MVSKVCRRREGRLGKARVRLAMSGALAGVAAGAFVPMSAWAAAGSASDASYQGSAAQAPAATIAREALPGWVVPRKIPAMDPAARAHISGGMAFLLLDSQVRGNPTGYDQVWRLATQAVDRTGLEPTGQIETEFDPRFETVTVNFVHVIRDGKVIDRTADAHFSVVEREHDLDEGIVSGNLKAIANIKDVRVGDVVDYSFTRHVRSTLWPGQYFNVTTARFSDPIALRAVRFLWPVGTPLTIRARNATMPFTERDIVDPVSGKMHEWQYIGSNPGYPPAEKNVPDWYPEWGQVQVSSMKDWDQMERWAQGLYKVDQTLPADYAARLDAIAAKYPDAADRMTQALRLVQDSIRYVGVELGEGSYVPRTPRVVIARGYGDCKDKALLLAVSLRHLGIDAVPALVNSDTGFGLPDQLPSPLDFDHVIVRAVLDGRVKWLDATATYQGGRGAGIVPADFGYALPIRDGQKGLEKMTGYAALAGTVNATETFTVDEKAKTAMTLHVETLYTDAQADWMRANVAQRGIAATGRQNLDYYHKRFAGLAEVHPVEFRDDREANRYVMIEDYALARSDFVKDKLLATFSTNAYLVNGLLPSRQNTPRRDPLYMPADLTRTQTIVLKAAGHSPGLLDDVDMRAQGVRFTRVSVLDGDTVTMTYRLTSDDRREVPAGDADAIYKIADRLSDATAIDFYLDKSPLRQADADGDDGSGAKKRPIDMAALAPYRADLARASKLMQEKDNASRIEALTIVNTVSAKLPRPSPAAGVVDGLKGALLAQLGRQAAARTALVSSVDQYQGTPEMINLLMLIQLSDDTPDGFLHTLELAAANQPDLVRGIDQQWIRVIAQNIHKLAHDDRQAATDRMCLALAGAGWQLSPRTAFGNSMLGCAIRAQLRKGDLPAARALLAKQPSADTLLGLAVDRRFAALWPDLEKPMASGFAGALARDVETARKASADAPGNLQALTRYVAALRLAGKPDEAVRAAKDTVNNEALIEAGGEDGFWLVNVYAGALSDAGKPDEALARMRTLVKLGVADNPMLASQAINLAGMELSAGNFQNALDQYHALEAAGDKYVNLFGHMYIWSGEACALRGLGRAKEAQPLEAKLAAHADENVSAMTIDATCRDDHAAIVAQLIAALDDPLKRQGALEEYAKYRSIPPEQPYAARQRAILDAARADPAVRKKLAEFGRVVPFAGVNLN